MLAQDKEGWNFILAPYILVPYVSGDIIVDGHESNIKETPGDMLQNSEIGSLLYFEAANPKWSLLTDIIFAKIGNEIHGN